MENTDSSAERQKFESVWKRVTARSDTAFGDYLIPQAPAAADIRQEEQKSPEADDTALLRQFISDEAIIYGSLRALAGRLGGSGASFRLCAQAKENLKKLQAAYFILTGKRYLTENFKAQKGTLSSLLYDLYWKEENSSQAFADASEKAHSRRLSDMFITISAIKKTQAGELENMIARFISTRYH